MHPEVLEFVRQVHRECGPWRRVLEYGSRNVNGTARVLFPRGSVDYIGIDVADGPGVDLIADARVWRPPAAWVPDAILCLEVLEHAPDWPRIVVNARRTLPVHGLLVVTCACDPRPPHGANGGPLGPTELYANIQPLALFKLLCRHWQSIDLRTYSYGDIHATAEEPRGGQP